MDGESKCNCQRCGNPIAFPLELNNTETECPHCGKATTLQVPRVRALPLETVPAISGSAPIPKEVSKDDFAALGFILAAIFPIGGIVVGLIQLTKGKSGLGAATIIASILCGIFWLAIFTD
jgi:predicted RNA-binding Zn-ribbon protein involved in translation (DUF1610 family)